MSLCECLSVSSMDTTQLNVCVLQEVNLNEQIFCLHHCSFDCFLLTVHCTYMCPFFLSHSFSLLSLQCSLSRSRLGQCPLNRPLHIGGRTSPLPRMWCPHTVPVLGLDGRSGSNWQGPWLALCARPLPCQLIGTASGQQRGRDTAALRLMDG